MFNKSIIAVAVLGAATFSAQAAFNLPYEHSQQQNNQWTAASQKVDKNFEAVKNEFDKINNALNSTPNQYDAQRWDDGITANKDQIAANKGQIAANKGQIAANKGQIAANKDQIKNNTNDIHDLQQKAVENALHDKNQDQNIGVNANNIEKNQQAIAANKDQIAANKDQIKNNTNNIEKNQQAIAANYKEMKNNFAAVNSRIDDLDEEMKKGFASQAALAGLFQPYNVGKFNLSVALGGYESEQAMALGTGYRFNENFAMKAGIATDVGGFDHLTYNIGANFEW